ncbi:MAG: hypothetical protein AB1724_16570 [Thermodesulfobacteriota bacterium]
MRNSNRFSRRDGLSLLVIGLVSLGIAMMPACSKKAEQEKAAVEKSAVPEKPQGIPAAASQDPRQEKILQLQKIQGELIAMQSATFKKYPELVKEQEGLRKLIDDKMQALLKPQKIDLQQIPELQKKLQDPNLPANERTGLMKDFQDKVQVVKKARVDAMNDPKIQEAYKQYETHLKEKLIAENPQATEKIADFDKIQAELQAINSKAVAGPAKTPMNQ